MGIWETEHHIMCQEVSTWKLSIFPKSTFLHDRLSPRTHTPEYKSLAGSDFSTPSRPFPIPGPGTWTESSQKKGKMARKFLKKFSSSIAKRELHIKTTFWFSSYSIQNKKKQANNNKYWRGHGSRNLIHCWRGCRLLQVLRKSVRRIVKKLKGNLLYEPAVPLLGMCPKDYTCSLLLCSQWLGNRKTKTNKLNVLQSTDDNGVWNTMEYTLWNTI